MRIWDEYLSINTCLKQRIVIELVYFSIKWKQLRDWFELDGAAIIADIN